MTRVLVDTQGIIWYSENDARLAPQSRAIIDEPSTECFVSVASVWEMAIKIARGNLQLRVGTLRQFVDLLPANDIVLLPVVASDAIAVSDLPVRTDHKDPFDRLLASQCLRHDLTLISVDTFFDAYGVRRVW